MSDLTDEQKKKLSRLGLKFTLRSLWNGINYGAMAVVANIILTIANIQFLNNDGVFQFFGCLFILIFVMVNLTAAQKENVDNFKKQVKEITK